MCKKFLAKKELIFFVFLQNQKLTNELKEDQYMDVHSKTSFHIRKTRRMSIIIVIGIDKGIMKSVDVFVMHIKHAI